MSNIRSPYIPRLCLIGVGLIGGSLVQALRINSAVGEVIGVGRNIENLELARSMGVIDNFTQDVQKAVWKADMVVIATPVGSFDSILESIIPNLGPQTIITDVGSVKQSLITSARQIMGDKIDQYVPAHPIAGGEKSGITAATANLFIDHQVILTPLVETRTQFIETVTQMWQVTGAQLVQMQADRHDQILAVTSHLPHMIVFALIDYLSRQAHQQDHYKFAAGGLFDLTRVASSDAVMWRDICLKNKNKISTVLREFADEIDSLADFVEDDKGDELEQLFIQAKQIRAKLADVRSSS